METRLTAFGSGFEVIRADATDVTVTTLRIIERFDVIGNVHCCHVSGMVDPFLDSFLLEAGKERLGYRVIPTVTTSAHAGLESIFPTEATPIVTAELAPLIRVNDRALWPTSLNSHHRSIQDQAAVYGRPRRPSDNLTGEQIHDHGQVQPALPGAEWSETPAVVELFAGLSSPNRTCTFQRIRLSI